MNGKRREEEEKRGEEEERVKMTLDVSDWEDSLSEGVISQNGKYERILEREQCIQFELKLGCPWDTELILRGLVPREKSGPDMCFGE